MTVEELLVLGKKSCHSDHAKILLAELLDKNPLELFNYLNMEVEEKIVQKYTKEIDALNKGIPLQYVIGNVNFLGNTFIINKNVLIPRFETEELVDYTSKYAKELFTDPVKIIDLGCGSGVIGLSLSKKISTKSVDLIDISEEALEVAKENAKRLDVKANFIHSDMWKNINKKYDIIISNPPYIKTDEEIEDIVKNNEPHIALYAGEDGLDCYRKIIKGIKEHSKEKCLIALEIGFNQANDIIELIEKELDNVKIEVKKDMSDKERMIFIFKNIE